MVMMSGPGPGWFENPENNGQLRWWSGEEWTQHTTPKQPAPVAMAEEAPYVPMAYRPANTLTETPKLKRGEKDRQIRRNNSFAYTGLVLSLVSILVNPLAILSILGIVFSSIGLAKANNLESRAAVTGRGTAIAGLIIGLASLVFFGWNLSRQLA